MDDYWEAPFHGFGSVHDLQEHDPRNPRLVGLKSVSFAAAVALRSPHRDPTEPGRSIGFHIRGPFTYVQAVDRTKAVVLMSSGMVLPITNLFDHEGDEAGMAEASAFVAGGNELWCGGKIGDCGPWPTVH